ncbi:hypothetical protein C8J57DRAFT_1589399 [Mycena rebaudengoi]|nr:hypothetical protein C8J57DRAFT_1589399 [Mycena rebaudengoi]
MRPGISATTLGCLPPRNPLGIPCAFGFFLSLRSGCFCALLRGKREAIAFEIAEIVSDVADKWGISIEGILIKVDSACLVRPAADILVSLAEMQIWQLEALQAMAKSGNTKVIFMPMQLHSNVIGQLVSGSSNYGGGSAIVQSESGEDAINRAGHRRHNFLSRASYYSIRSIFIQPEFLVDFNSARRPTLASTEQLPGL